MRLTRQISPVQFSYSELVSPSGDRLADNIARCVWRSVRIEVPDFRTLSLE